MVDSALVVLSLDEDDVVEDPAAATATYLHNKGFNRYFIHSYSMCLHSHSMCPHSHSMCPHSHS